MHNSRLGCFTLTGIIAALITAVIIAVVAFTQGGVLYSPGALNAQSGEILGGVTSHAETGGDCKACHVAPWGSLSMADRCTTCHADVAVQMREVASLHGAMKNKNPTLNCAPCHPDHRGADASLTVATTADFPHESLGYSLIGHQFKVTREAFVCSDCHADDITTFNPTACADCHRQMDAAFTTAHETSWGSDCLSCHDGVDTYGNDFDHNKFAFPLMGRHVEISCYDCHTNAHTITDLQAAPQDCASCHLEDDAHAGRFGADCAACHSSDDWLPARFDHNLSAFKLEGEHTEADCEDCHKNNVYQGTPSDCYSCHAQDDEHGGKFGTDCAACHTPSGWEAATFDHSRSNFPLTGAHQQIDCEKCHVNAQFAGTPTTCVACHADPVFHAGLFGTDCASCHTTTAWSPATFNGQHTFPLDHGESGMVSCATCHPSSFTTYTCYGCHEHNEAEVRSEHLDEGISNFQNCMECHPTGNEHEGGGGGDD
ncbi:MAG: cytochrome c3 family protein [Chloroflexota bacterium]